MRAGSTPSSGAAACVPEAVHRMLPTRLGNTLRRHEDQAGRQYGLDAITVAPHLRLSADPAHYAYVEDAGDQLDLALRVCVLAIASTAATLALLLPAGVWAALPAAPYAIAYLAYRVGVASASAYATAVATVIDLNRFELYDKLNVARPHSLADEVQRNQDLMRVLNGESLPMKHSLRFTRRASF